MFGVDAVRFEHFPRLVSFCLISKIIVVVKEYPHVEDYNVHCIHNLVLGDRAASIGGILLYGSGTRNEFIEW